MALDHANATATVFVDGLGVCCYNRGEKKWDLAFLHDDEEECEHNLVLLVIDGDTIKASYDLNDASLVEIIAENPQTPDYPGSPNGFFDLGRISHRKRQENPATTDEKENFRWTINLEDQRDVPHGRVTLRKPDFPLTRAFIHDGVFYTVERSPENLLLTLDKDDDPHENPNWMGSSEITAHTLGKTNDLIAADIFCSPDGGKVVIVIDDTPLPPLPHRPGNPWKISLTNLCDRSNSTGATFEKGDFHHFYDVLEGFTQRHAIWGVPVRDAPRPAREPGESALLLSRVSGRTDCDTTFLSPDTQTLDPLF